MTTNTDYPPVAVVINTMGDRPDMLAKTLDSVLAQDYPGPVEIVVVFDRSTPDESLRTRGVTLTTNTRAAHLGGARNSGVLASTAPVIAFCDDDVLWRPSKLRLQVAALNDLPGSVLASCGTILGANEGGHTRVLSRRQITFDQLLRSRVGEASGPSVLFRRDPLAMADGGISDEELPGGCGEDYDLLLRAARIAPVAYVPEALVELQPHDTSHYTERWGLIAESHEWLLGRHAEFKRVPRGYARLCGIVGFAHANAGNRREALSWAWKTFVASPLEPRSYVVALMASGLLRPSWVVKMLAATGRGA